MIAAVEHTNITNIIRVTSSVFVKNQTDTGNTPCMTIHVSTMRKKNELVGETV